MADRAQDHAARVALTPAAALNASPHPHIDGRPIGAAHPGLKKHAGARRMWSGPKGSSMEDRLTRAQEAKKALLERFKTAPKPGDAEYEEQQAKLKAIAEARREREELRARQKAEDESRRAEEARLKSAREAEEARI